LGGWQASLWMLHMACVNLRARERAQHPGGLLEGQCGHGTGQG
jgi:hypothetical protein